MDISSILLPVASIGGMGLIFGAGLGVAAIKLKVEQDPRIPQVRECLPGANCGGCGFAGCDALAEAIVNNKAPVNACPVGGAACASRIGAVLGIAAEVGARKVAFVKCSGNCDAAKDKFEYYGEKDCDLENGVSGGHKACAYGCLGDGNCVRVCKFDALRIINGVAVVDTEKCVACGACTKACPKHLIELVPDDKKVRVSCSSHDMPKPSKDNCSNACMGCKLCEKNCPSQAVTVTDFLAKVDYEKCTQCGVCTQKCPTKAISEVYPIREEVKEEVS